MKTQTASLPIVENTPPNDGPGLHPFTIMAIAVVAYSASNVLHEGLGHGGATWLLGGKARYLTAISYSFVPHSLSANGVRLVSAAGGVVNMIFALFTRPLSRNRAVVDPALRYFFWLFSAINFLQAFGYFLFSGAFGIGDWMSALGGFVPAIVTRIALTAVGAALYFGLAPRLVRPTLETFLDPHFDQKTQFWRLTRLPYLTGGATFFLASLPNPGGAKILMISGLAASFGATALLATTRSPSKLAASQSTPNPQRPSEPVRKGWIVAGAAAAVLFIGVLGYGLRW